MQKFLERECAACGVDKGRGIGYMPLTVHEGAAVGCLCDLRRGGDVAQGARARRAAACFPQIRPLRTPPPSAPASASDVANAHLQTVPQPPAPAPAHAASASPLGAAREGGRGRGRSRVATTFKNRTEAR